MFDCAAATGAKGGFGAARSNDPFAVFGASSAECADYPFGVLTYAEPAMSVQCTAPVTYAEHATCLLFFACANVPTAADASRYDSRLIN